MKRSVAFAMGVLFAVGLALSGMTRPGKVIGFLDLAGAWNHSLALVMGSAILVFSSAYWLSRGMKKPFMSDAFSASTAQRVDMRLVAGAALFGVGWGVAGFCPGPALVSAATGGSQAVAFCAAMGLGFWSTRMLDARIKRAPASTSATG